MILVMILFVSYSREIDFDEISNSRLIQTVTIEAAAILKMNLGCATTKHLTSTDDVLNLYL